MTACTNNGGSRARRAVTAALVGVLSVGAAPMVALATGAAPASGDVQVLANENPGFQQGTINYADDLESGKTFVYTTDTDTNVAVPQGLVPESVTLYNSTELAGEGVIKYVDTITSTKGIGTQSAPGYYYAYVRLDSAYGPVGNGVSYDNADGVNVTPLRGEVLSGKPSNPGNYAVVVFYQNPAATQSYVSKAGTFSIVNAGLEGATLYEGSDVTDNTFAYTGKQNGATWGTVEASMGVAVNGVKLSKTVDFNFGSCYEDGSTTPLTSTTNLKPGVTYRVEVEGEGAYADVDTTLTFTYQALVLNDATVVSKGVTTTVPSTADITTIVSKIGETSLDPNTFGGANARLAVKCTEMPDGGMGSKGEYTFLITPSEDDEEGYVTGEATATVIVADATAHISYDGTLWSSKFTTGEYKYDMTDSTQKPFDVDEIAAAYNGVSVPFEVTVKNAKTGLAASVDNLDDLGEWLVTVTAKGTASNRYVAQIETVKVVNYNDITDAQNVFVSYDGSYMSNMEHATDTYTGEDFSEKLSVKVSKDGKEYVEGTDYTVAIEKRDASGKWASVDGIVDAGNYRVTIKGVTFSDSGQYFIDINKRDLDSIAPSNAFAVEDVTTGIFRPTVVGHVYYYAYTGEEIAPEFTFTGDDGKTYTVPADEFEVTYNKDELKDKGDYVVTGVKFDSTNYENDDSAAITLAGTSKIVVTDASSFADVPNDAWYAEAVATAKQQGYIGGVGGSNLFAPMRNMSRADVVCVLYRMAGGTIDNEGMTDAEKTYISDFTDVDEGAYYAKAVSWAVKTGIARGYGDTFGTSRDVTTEEFATMLARYAASVGTDTSVDTDAVLAGVADGDKVSSYARDAVAWAVENGYVASNGNLIDPQGSVYRARVVTIAVRYQPEQLHVIL
ncbi:S-layer homology domain-containing protein [Thermophilibacter mediterraneus]|uniref:S-layer homology domain-containing protein n=1 Tax=Thermophilibacter mediterraneus TaxID=1871031 RepID=UPI00320856D8